MDKAHLQLNVDDAEDGFFKRFRTKVINVRTVGFSPSLTFSRLAFDIDLQIRFLPISSLYCVLRIPSNAFLHYFHAIFI